jgi:tetratricopeptide (TPR) repeat protein
VRSAGVRAWPGIAALALSFCALFFANGPLALEPLVWIGGLALVAGAVAVLWASPPGGPALAYLGCLFGLALWCGVTIVWSASPDRSWVFTNRTLAYAGFALLGVLVGPQLERVAAAATAVAAAVLGWALLAKCVPALYGDYGRLSRLRAPLDDWNMLALVCVAAVPLALWLAARHSRTAGVVLLYAAVVALLLTYSRFGVALACLAAAGWVIREPERVERLVELALAALVGAGVYAAALALDGITSDGTSHSVRVHDGALFALVLLAGGAVVALAGRLAPPVPEARRAGIERVAAVAAIVVALAGLGATFVRAHSVWNEFTNPGLQVTNQSNRVGSLSGGNRWQWWQEAWQGFTGHPLGGTGAGTFQFTDLRLRSSSDVTALEPHNTPLQFLSETGAVGFLLFLGAAGVALLVGFRRPGPLPLVVAAFFAHSVVNYDWSFLAVCGPFLLLGGVLVARGQRETARRPLAALAAVAFALACAYSLAAPWLAQRAEARLDLAQAHSYDPLNTGVLTLQATLATDPRVAERYYRDAVALEPTNAALWLEFARFYAEAGDWVHAYHALTHAYENDPLGPAGQCGLAQQIRRKVGVRSTCRGAGSPSIP